MENVPVPHGWARHLLSDNRMAVTEHYPRPVAAPRRRTRRPRSRVGRLTFWLTGVVVSVLVLLFVAAFFIDEPLRRYMVRTMNEKMVGYTIYIPGFDFNPFGFRFTFKDLTVMQDQHPNPPVMYYPIFRFSVDWWALLRANLVADAYLEKPLIYIDRTHMQTENRDKVPVQDKGWQDALQAMYPLELNEIKVVDGDITYVDDDPKKPLRLNDFNMVIRNIRNVQTEGDTYPSDLYIDSGVLETGKLHLVGHANFLAKPQPGFRATMDLQGVHLDRMKPVVARTNVRTSGGVVSAAGDMEYTSKGQTSAHLKTVTIKDWKLDYVKVRSLAEAKRVADVKEQANELADKPTTNIKVDELKIASSTFGYVNESTKPDYRAYISDATITLRDYSNQPEHGPLRASLTGRFMGSGRSKIDTTLLSTKNAPEFDLALRIEDTDMRAMNDILRAYGNFDVRKGSFSFFSELSAHGGRIDGYVKPLFKDLDVYDRRQDAEKSLFQQVYEGLTGGVAELFENRRDEVATKADVGGRIDNPRTSTLQVVLRLVENAFFKSILPGFDREVTGLKKDGKREDASAGDEPQTDTKSDADEDDDD